MKKPALQSCSPEALKISLRMVEPDAQGYIHLRYFNQGRNWEHGWIILGFLWCISLCVLPVSLAGLDIYLYQTLSSAVFVRWNISRTIFGGPPFILLYTVLKGVVSYGNEPFTPKDMIMITFFKIPAIALFVLQSEWDNGAKEAPKTRRRD